MHHRPGKSEYIYKSIQRKFPRQVPRKADRDEGDGKGEAVVRKGLSPVCEHLFEHLCIKPVMGSGRRHE